MYNQWAMQIAATAAVQMGLQYDQNALALMANYPMAGQYPNSAIVLNDDDDSVEEVEEEDEVDDEQQRTLFCANLDERVTEELLYEVFLQAGPLETVRIPKDNTGRQRTFGFVTYVHQSSPSYAMQLLQGLTLFHKQLTIKHQGKTAAQAQAQAPTNYSHYPAQQTHLPQRRSGGDVRNCDNSALRGSNFAAFHDPSGGNPFRGNMSADWTAGSASGSIGRREHAAAQRHSKPYQRTEHSRRSGGGGAGGGGDWDRDHYKGNNRARNHHNDGNRRSDQRAKRSI